MKNKFILLAALMPLISCNPKQFIDKNLKWDNEYYSYKLEGKISKDIKYRFTATLENINKYVYFGICDYVGNEPYFDIGYNDSNKTVNVFNIYKVDGENKTTISRDEMHYYSQYRLFYMENKFAKNNSIVVECTITKDLSNGLWAYVGCSDGTI